MPAKFRLFAAYLLLLLLPFQAIAGSVAVSCFGMAACADMKEMDCCEHAGHVFDTDGRFHAQQDSQHDRHGDYRQADMTCGFSTTCMAVSPVVSLPVAHRFMPGAASSSLPAFTPTYYTSFISDGLQRPPSIPVYSV
ncbi:hypothetical protein [Undibacterium sp.]|uniref:hypothetical protein n=1 Tax=Undibacterium sp. TaxID=1914977 RepID=UPI002C0A70AA|nr:hypothetical protein [Undibacterium sp.]HTD03890.1 hypothetical protein [Undibacterium sp.]